jgi:hypothetical protein
LVVTDSVSVVIPTRARDILRRGVNAVIDEPAVGEVIVVPDGERATSRMPALLGVLLEHPRLRIVSGPGRGAGDARAVGATSATSDVVLMLDDDVVAEPGLPSGHLQHHRRRESLVVVGSMPVDEHLLGTSAPARAYAADYERVRADYERSDDEVLFNLWCGNLSIRRSDCLRVGVANGAFPYRQHEDRDFGLRCQAAGLSGVFDGTLGATHHYVRSGPDFLKLARQQVVEARAIHALHANVLGPWRPDTYGAGVPRPLRWMLHSRSAAEDEGGNSTTLRALRVIGSAARTAHVRRFEDRALTLSRSVVQHATARSLMSQSDERDGRGGDRRRSGQATSDAMPATIMTKPRTT